MWFSIEIDQPKNPSYSKRTWCVRSARTEIGRAATNHLLLFHPEVPRKAGTLERHLFSLTWRPAKGEGINALQREVLLGPFRIRARMAWRFHLAFVFLSLVLIGVEWRVMSQAAQSEVSFITVNKPIFLPAPDVYGNPRGVKEQNEVRFTFEEQTLQPSQVMELHFTPGNIQRSDQLEVWANDHSLGFAAVCPEHWGTEARFQLDHLNVQSKIQEVTFKNHPNKGSGKIWGVRNIYITHSEHTPATVESVEVWYAKAKMALEQSSAQTGQLWRGEQYIQRAVNLSRRVSVQTPQKISGLKRRIEAAEKKMISRYRSEAKAAMSIGDVERARLIYQKLISEFIDPNDSRRQLFQHEMEEALR